jgi:serine acetyltransferase
MASIAVLGAGSHGRQVAYDLNTRLLFDDLLDGYQSCKLGAHEYPWVVGAFWPETRRKIAESVVWQCEPFQRGVYVAPSAFVGIEVFLGDHVHVNPLAVVSHECVLEEYVSVGSGAVLCGQVTVEAGATVGAGAVVKHGGIRIGAGAMVGMGAVVTKDVAPGEVVKGVPARVA